MTFPSPLSQPHPGAGAPIATAADTISSLPVPPRKGRTASIWVIGVLVLVLVALVGYFLDAIGPAASIIGMILALIPLAVVLIAVRLVDKWEPEPRSLVIMAVAWGAIVAVGLTLGVDMLLSLVWGANDSVAGEAFASVIQAPIVEELAKGLGVFVIFASARRAFDGPIDGVVYGALVGAGFAFTENIQYFAVSLIEGGVEQTTVTFFVRGILSPFAHVMFTSVTGFALGLAARRGLAPRNAVGYWIVGMLGAMLLHALWNASAVFFDFFALYVTLQIPLFILFILGVIALRREEARLTRVRLADYAAAGWFTVQEVEMLATGQGRRAAMAWARSLPGDRRAVMKGFIADATGLAAARQRSLSGRDPAAAEDEAVLLTRTAAARAVLFAR
ncbi:hypothetical protein ASD65_18215 [Microbacterium sp. Root61]|uniref:PrsW family intramembrane metalloprotease n=1 Tax=Microbacterium sp. Root61 TaxID=1736570 RepID=UPI0006FF0A6C|nr:PrsW family intramembrane metalloprotease [Microbacterium sp. Root61]KRA22408.1 hypothetical protein ASD65_18215 [Microbacterium sp. Root61]